MKKYRKLWLPLALTLLLAAGAFAAACGEPSGGTTSGETKYTLTLRYDGEKGSVSVRETGKEGSSAGDSSEWTEGTALTVSVAAETGFYVGAFTVNGNSETLNGGGYAFTIAQNTTIEATFLPVQGGGGDDNDDPSVLSFPQSFRGTWKTREGRSIVINSFSLSMTAEDGAAVQTDGGYTVVTPEGAFTLQGAEGSEWILLLSGSGGTAYYLKEGRPDLSVGEQYFSDYAGENGEKLGVSEEGTSLDGTPGEIVGNPSEGTYLVLFEELYTLSFTAESVTVAPYGGEPTVFPKDRGVDLGAQFDQYWIGTWNAVSGEDELIITAHALTYNGDAPQYGGIAARETGGYTFTIGDKTYEIEWYGMIEGVVLAMHADGTVRYFTGGIHPVFGQDDAIEQIYYRGSEGTSFTWKRLYGNDTLEIDARSIRLGGAAAEIIVDTGYIETFIDPLGGLPIEVRAHCYYFFTDGTPHLLYWEPYSEAPVVDGVFYTDGAFALPESMLGTWQSLEDGAEMVVTTRSVTIGGEDAQLTETAGGFTVVLNGTVCMLGSYPNSTWLDGREVQTLLCLEEVPDDPLAMGKRHYFLNALLADRTVGLDSSMQGTWKSQGSGDDFTVGEEVRWGERKIRILSESHEADSPVYSYLLSVDGELSTIEYYSGIAFGLNVGWDSYLFLKDPAIDKTSEGTIAPAVRGIYHLSLLDRILVVEAERITIYTTSEKAVYTVSDSASVSTFRAVQNAQGEFELYFTLTVVEGSSGGTGYCSAVMPAAAGDLSYIDVRVTIRGGEAVWSEYGVQGEGEDAVEGWFEQQTYLKSSLF